MSKLVEVTGVGEDHSHVLTATMSSPPANALSLDLIGALDAALDVVERERARVLVIRSSLEGFFAAGADLKLLGNTDQAGIHDYLVRLRGVLERLASMPIASIAAIDGHALGGGLELALACTMRVGGPRARLGVPEIKLGVIPGAAGTQRLVHVVGPGAASDLLLTGRSARPDEALRLRLLDRYDENGAVDAANAVAQAIAQFPKSAIGAVQRCVRAAVDLPLEQGLAVEEQEIMELFPGADAKEGIAAFLEKRPARFAP